MSARKILQVRACRIHEGAGGGERRGNTTEEKKGLVTVAALPGAADALQVGVGGG